MHNFIFFSIAHTITEKVTEQASIMVNGKLKEYQIRVRGAW
jgi:SWI/SNF-related matrix-associated actin-dependent regulator of chromatin subfamily A protein 2/4